MPIDPVIALGVKAPQFQDPLDQYAKVAAIQGSMQQQDTGALQQEQLRRQMAEQDRVLAAFRGMKPGQSIEDILPQVMQASPTTGITLQKNVLENRKNQADINHVNAQTVVSQLASSKAVLEDGLRQLSQATPENWAQIRQQALASHGKQLNPEQLAQASAEFPEQYPGPEWVNQHMQALMSAKEKADFALNATNKLMTPDGRGGFKVNMPLLQAEIAKSQGDITMAPGGANAGAAGAARADMHGDEFLSTMPKARADQVKALAEGRMQFPAGFALKSPYWQRMISDVSQYDPNFDAVNYNARAKTRASLAAGPMGQNLTAINTAIGHLDSFDKAATALGNGNYPAFNKIWNAVVPQAGGAEMAGKIRTFEQAKEAVSNELMRVFRGAGASTSDTQKWSETLNAADSPTALKAAVRSAVDLLDSRIGAITQQYQTGMGTTAEPLQTVYPKAKATLDRLRGGQTSGTAPTAPSAPAAPQQSFQSLPDPSQFSGKFMTDTNTGGRYQSNGKAWVRVPGASGGY